MLSEAETRQQGDAVCRVSGWDPWGRYTFSPLLNQPFCDLVPRNPGLVWVLSASLRGYGTVWTAAVR